MNAPQQPGAMPTAQQMLANASHLFKKQAETLRAMSEQSAQLAHSMDQGMEMLIVFDQVHQRIIAQNERCVAQLNIFVDALTEIRDSGDANAAAIAMRAFVTANQLTQ